MNTRTKSTGILIGTLLVGVLLGSVITGAVYQNRMEKQKWLRKPGGFVEHVREMVRPHDDKQWETIRPIVEKAGSRNRGIMDHAHGELRITFDSLLVELAPHLDADQMNRLKKMCDKTRHKPEGDRGDPGDGPSDAPPPPPPGR